MKVIILKGLPASGKTTWAKNELKKGNIKRVNKDDLRLMLDDGKWSNNNEEFILKMRDWVILAALNSGNNVIVDDTNLSQKHENHIKELVRGIADVEVKFFEISVEEAIKRDLARPVSVGEKVIRGMYKQFLKPGVEKYVLPADKPEAYIFDIDGTLAKMNGRGSFDWDKVDTDLPNIPVATIQGLIYENYNIIIFSGRDEVCREKTENWLRNNCIFYDKLLMRPAGDNRKDAIIKKELFDKVKNDYRILGVFDDRNQVVEMWRDIGLTCFQVDDGNF